MASPRSRSPSPSALPLQTSSTPTKDLKALLKEFKCPTSPFDPKKQKVEKTESEGGAEASPKVVVEVQSSSSNGHIMKISTPAQFKLDVIQALAYPTPPDQVAGNYVFDECALMIN